MQRTCRYEPLSKPPLVLVLCQVRFSAILRMADYIPAIQEELRRHRYPIERAGKVQQLVVTSSGVQSVEQERWEYRTKDETWSILVLPNSVVLQTTSYQRFEDFAEQLRLALDTVLSKTEHDKFGVVHRVGLRYIDLVQPGPDQDYRFYLRDGFHGIGFVDQVFQPPVSHRLYAESMGNTAVGDTPGTLIVRITQNDQGIDLPLDLAGASAPKHVPRARPGELVTYIDMDHFVEGSFAPSTAWVIEKAYQLHDHLIETFYKHVVTPEALKAWR